MNKGSKDIVVRVFSPAGRSRIEINSSANYGALCTNISEHLKIPASSLQLYKDEKYRTRLSALSSYSLAKAGITDGIIIYVQNACAKIPIAGKAPAQEPVKKEVSKTGKISVKAPAAAEEKKDTAPEKPRCSHGPGAKCLNCAGATAEELANNKFEGKCDHPPNGKCPRCMNKGFIQDAKHISFDNYLNELKMKCKNLHGPDAHCHNCLPPTQISYKLKPGCKEHAPYPAGMCTKCMPPAAQLKRQFYRHVDYVQFMNFEEINSFMTSWSSDFSHQRMGYLYGYYAKDPNYPDGVRAVVEAIYEPPQKGTVTNVTEMEDKNQALVDQIAQALDFIKIGWIFTSSEGDVFLSSSEILKIAKYQNSHCITHPSGARVSKFVSVKGKMLSMRGETGLEASMVSDQCQALVRDNVLCGIKDNQHLEVRKPSPTEVVPTVLPNPENGVPVDYFVVNVSHGAPIEKNGFNTLQFFDFPRENRGRIITKGDLKTYFLKHNKREAKSYLDFHMLICLAQHLDLESAKSVIKTSMQNKPPLPGIVDLISHNAS